MKLIPRSKNVGLVFFVALIVAALFLFVSDKVGSKSPSSKPTLTFDGRQEESLAEGGGLSSAAFSRVDWQAVLDQTGAGISVSPSYAPTDLQVKENPTKSDLRSYAADLKQALGRYADPKLPSEVKIMLTAYEANDPSGLALIDPIESLHTATLADLAKIKVPGEMMIYHLTIMNALRAMTLADEGMKSLFTNQDLTLAAAKAYAADIDSLNGALQKISTLLLKRGIILAESEKLQIYLGLPQ